ncbi:response regulator [Pedobacter arcticus]|uniref:response regulator n=1 Tax=Pedobacter arcticus TaxID=752140 RepID=UPI00036B0F7D|nr:response regulator [Pedobacter arcticus]
MHKKEILIIDDDYRNIFALKMVLQARKLQCQTALSFKDAKEILNANNNVALILMDMMMPETDGYQAIDLLKKEGSEIPIIALTAQAMTGDKEKCIAAGADGYVAKPVNIDHLMVYIEKYL